MCRIPVPRLAGVNRIVYGHAVRPLDPSVPHAGGRDDLVRLDPEHPGFRDPIYRDRRNTIAQIALAYRTGRPVPEAPYTEEEHGVWRAVWETLGPVHEQLLCRDLLDLQRSFPIGRDRIPQLCELNPRLSAAAGYRMEPVAGLVTARTFLQYLGRRVFLSTQYIRHHSKPFYTPEPDVVHELVGHAATLAHPDIAELNRLVGEAADVASDAEMLGIERVYWYTMEFGVVEERGEPHAFGAGLLSSVGELENMRSGPILLGWDLDRIAATPYDPTDFQPQLFVAPSFKRMLVDTAAWIRDERWRVPRVA